MLRSILTLLFSAALLTACDNRGDTIGSGNPSSSSARVELENSYWEGTWVDDAGEIIGFVRILYGEVAAGTENDLRSVTRLTSNGFCILQDNRTAEVGGSTVEINVLDEVRLTINYTSNSLGDGFVYTSSGSCVVGDGRLFLERSVLLDEDDFELLLFPNQAARTSTTTVEPGGEVVHEELEPAPLQGGRDR